MPILLRALFVSLLLFAGLSANATRADWINLTGAETAPNIAEITVLDDRVRVVLEVYIGNLSVFEALLPDDWLKKDISSRPPLAERLKRFSAAAKSTLPSSTRETVASLSSGDTPRTFTGWSSRQPQADVPSVLSVSLRSR